MKLKKKLFFDIHSWIGVRLAILFFIVCFSGTLATLSHEMDWLFLPEIRAKGNPDALASRNLIVENFVKAHPKGTIEFWLRTEEPYLCDILYKNEDGQRSYVFANPYTGVIQGEVKLTFQRFFRDLHYFLFIPFQIGHFTVLMFAFLMLVSLITALVFYKKWWRKLFQLKTGKGPLVLFRSLHRLVGLWSVPFTLLFSITGIWYFLERANIADIGKISNPKPPKVVLNDRDTIGAPKSIRLAEIDFDRAIAVAEREIPGVSVGNILPSTTDKEALYLIGKGNVPLVRQRANRVYLNPITYKTIKVQRAQEIGAMMYLNDIADPLHFGYWGGLVTKIIWFVFGLGISSLVLTGIWITLKRRAIKRKESGKSIMGTWWYVNWGLFVTMLFFMYYRLIDRYDASIVTTALITLGWCITIFLTWYVFIYRLNRTIDTNFSERR